jgi:alkylhydroperoxidase family enzyme
MRYLHSRHGVWVAVLALVGPASSARAQPKTPPASPTSEPPVRARPAEEDGPRAARWLREAFKGQPVPEAAEMLIAIAAGSQMGPGDGWFHPGQSRYGWKWLAERHGIPPGGAIPRAQFHGPEALFARLDRNKDGVLRADDFDWSDRSPYAQQAWMANRVFRRINEAADGRLTREQWLRFFDEAAGGKDHLTTDDLREALLGGAPAAMSPNDMPTPQVLVRGLFRGEIGSMHEGPKLNDPAPDFTLKSRDGKTTVHLGEHVGKRPVVLVFGNFTCGPFRAAYPRVEELAQRYKGETLFLAVYVREAHPTDGWRMGSNDDAGVAIAQPRDYAERAAAADRCSAQLKMSMPLLVDELDDRVGHAYSGMPARLYVIDRDGRVAYKSGRGPFGFKPDELEQALAMLLLDQQPAATKITGRLPMLGNEEAWKRLPGAPGQVQPLPAWARMLAGPLPLTTARMLELDALHRTGDRLDPRLRGLVRWAAADANRCDYAKAIAAADLRRAGVSDPGHPAADAAGSPAERAAVGFARKMMREAHAVTDAEVKQLIDLLGEERVVALVALLAHASFQDRIFLALNLPAESEPVPPLTVAFARPKAGGPGEAKPPAKPDDGPSPPAVGAPAGPAWLELQDSLEKQRARSGRIRVPSLEEVLGRIGKDHPGAWQNGILWSRVCYGFQPELTQAWFDCVTALRQESHLDRIFSQCIFWVVTQSLQCFY